MAPISSRKNKKKIPLATAAAFRFLIGTKISKHFEGHGCFTGEVVDRTENKVDATLWYRVLYEDNDEEDMEENDLAALVVTEADDNSKKRRSSATTATESNGDKAEDHQQTKDDDDLVTIPSSTAASKRRKTTTAIVQMTSSKARGVTPSPVTSNSNNNLQKQEEDTATKTPTKTGNTNRKRKTVTTSPHFASKKSNGTDAGLEDSDNSEEEGDDGDGSQDEEDEWQKPLAELKSSKSRPKKKLDANKSQPASTMRATASKKKVTGKLAAKKAADIKKETPPKNKATPKKSAKTKKAAAAAAAAAAPDNQPPPPPNAGPPLLMAEDTDSDDEKDRPFRVEYSISGRSTCRTCDKKIEKGVVRVCSRPLFRGKPGFVVYRHLQCQILPEEIRTMQDVGGWRRLRAEDRKLLAKQVGDSKVKIKEENEELHADELVQTKFQGELRPAPQGLSATLLPFQQEGVSWMYNQEVNTEMVKGGILADEMGMGKTLQTITCILDNRPKLQHSKPGAKHPPSAPDIDSLKREESLWDQVLKECHHDLDMAGVPESVLKVKKKKGAVPIGARAGTLIVVPVIAMYQWQEEIKKFTEENTLSVCFYHGNDRQAKYPREILCKYDIILTTYQVIESDFRKMVSPNKVTCPNCARKFKIDKLAVHLKYFCGETAQRTEAQSRQRRTADRHQRPGQNIRPDAGSGGKGGKKKFPSKQTKTATNAKEALPKTAAQKKTIRAKSNEDYDTDSDLSLPDDMDVLSSRPSRSAATAAKKKMTSSSKDWAGAVESDSDPFSESVDSSTESSVDEFEPSNKSAVPRRGQRKKGVGDESDESDDELDEDSESEDEAVLARARKRQKIALAQIKNTKKGQPAKKSFPLTKKDKSKPASKGKGKTKFPGGKDDSSDSDDENDDLDDEDPLASVDMDALKAEALEGCAVSVLHTMCFWRIVLDEAHMIKSRSSQTATAAFHLSSVHRWALSGTPLQNRVGELYSLIRFLRLDPMAHYFCRRNGCDCKSIYYRMENGKCKDCGCASSQHYSHFNKHILNVIQREGYTGDGRRAMMKLKSEVLDKCLLRRTKESRAEDMNLPPRVVTIKAIRLHPREEDFYNALYTQSKSSFDDYVQEGSILNNYAHVFDLLTKMRQAVDHPYLIVHSKKAHAAKLVSGGQQGGPAVANGSTVCEICEETPTDRVVSSCCSSAFCRSCVLDMMSLETMQQDGGLQCLSCRRPFSIDLNQVQQEVEDDSTLKVTMSTVGMPSLREMSHVASGSILRRINLADFATSTKVEALVQELVQMRQERQGSKALVFSQFVNMLDLVRWRLHSDPCLQDLGLGVRIIHGGMNVQSRDEALKAFREDPTIRVLLMSLKAGGVALNLTVANEAYLLDPWWNPAAEMQAIDRTHRLGQYRPIRAIRFIAEGTVEERVLQLQEKKRLVFDGTVGRDAASLKMLTVDDMKALFT